MKQVTKKTAQEMIEYIEGMAGIKGIWWQWPEEEIRVLYEYIRGLRYLLPAP